ncbi:hypothetical protein NIIDMKKI_69340 [Mycobacterium kansasii]|uniref:MobA-like NTP transferase domain-containing protein n=1 Tax=Mycobacterium kansasii TaxID=1768 RepID=A0A7G1ISJ6_MYCKA|nr:hypothetical protein NIIDMKKI_69340 [Mycobacterium kansasii]
MEGWLEAALDALAGGGCTEVVVVLGAAQVTVPPGVTAITAADWQQGLSASVRAGLAQADRMYADYAVLHVVDTPDVDASVVARVVNRALASRSGLARAYFGERPGHPVVIARGHWPAVLGAISGTEGRPLICVGRRGRGRRLWRPRQRRRHRRTAVKRYWVGWVVSAVWWAVVSTR